MNHSAKELVSEFFLLTVTAYIAKKPSNSSKYCTSKLSTMASNELGVLILNLLRECFENGDITLEGVK